MAGLKVKETALLALLSAILLIGQIALGFLPNIEVVTLLIMVYSIVFRKKVFFIIYVFVLAEGLVYGFGIWWFNYLYVWSIQAVINLLFRKQKSVVFWSILSGFYGITFGALCSLPYFAIGGPSAAFAYWVSGLAYDIPPLYRKCGLVPCAVQAPCIYTAEKLQGNQCLCGVISPQLFSADS